MPITVRKRASDGEVPQKQKPFQPERPSVRVVKASSKVVPPAPKPQALESEFLTVRQVAERLQVSDRQVWRWIEVGELLATRLGRSVRIHIDDFRAFWAARREVR